MKISYIFTATGKYSKFIPGLVESGINNFFPEYDTDFIVFTDSDEYRIPKLKTCKVEKMGWPYDTLYRFHLIDQINHILNSDYLFYGNANMIFNSKITEDILPTDSYDMVASIHPCFYNENRRNYPYDRNPSSTAFVHYGEEGENYFQGCFFGGEKESFIKMSKEIKKNIDADLQNNVIALWHDESHMNKYFIKNPPKALHSGYVYPENMNIPFDKKIIQLDKNNHGGHGYLRS